MTSPAHTVLCNLVHFRAERTKHRIGKFTAMNRHRCDSGSVPAGIIEHHKILGKEFHDGVACFISYSTHSRMKAKVFNISFAGTAFTVRDPTGFGSMPHASRIGKDSSLE
jgi:hypothetical protein